MKITVIGTGYVGLVSGVCLAELGNEVVCMDINLEKVKLLSEGVATIYEPDLQELMEKNLHKGQLSFTGNIEQALRHGGVIIIAVDTPSDTGGRADLSRLQTCLLNIGLHMENRKTIVIKSTAPVGTTARAAHYLEELLEKRSVDFGFGLVFNPEFLREGSAVSDFMRPDRIVIGTQDSQDAKIMSEVYQPLCEAGCPMLCTNFESAEMIKYASNALLATKVSFINEIADFCQACGANVQEVAKGVGMDQRIGRAFLQAGPGFGGSCFPKDTRALVKAAEDYQVNVSIVRAVIKSNNDRKAKMLQMIVDLAKKTQVRSIAVLGVAFKANTDDVRESPALEIIRELPAYFESIRIYDPEAMENARKILPESKHLNYANSAYQAAEGSEALLILTEWSCFKDLDFEKIRSVMRGQAVIDLRNLLEKKLLERIGFEYHGLAI